MFSLLPRPQTIPKLEVPKKDAGLYEMVVEGLSKTNLLQQKGEMLTKQLVTGEVEHLHEAMIAFREAEIALNFVMAIRNNLLRAYQEVLAMGR